MERFPIWKIISLVFVSLAIFTKVAYLKPPQNPVAENGNHLCFVLCILCLLVTLGLESCRRLGLVCSTPVILLGPTGQPEHVLLMAMETRRGQVQPLVGILSLCLDPAC